MDDGQSKHLVYTVMLLANKYSLKEIRSIMYHEYPKLSTSLLDGVIEETLYILHRFR